MDEKELELTLHRLAAPTEIMNTLATYESYRAASMNEEALSLFSKKEDAFVRFSMIGKWKGQDGIKRFHLGFSAGYEKDMTGRINQRELMSPNIQVAADGQSAKLVCATIGIETPKTKEGLLSLWAWGKAEYDMSYEDGAWKILHMTIYYIFLTPFGGNGWTDVNICPYEDADPFDFGDPRYAPDEMADFEHFDQLGFYVQNSADFDLHNLIPAPPKPY